MLLSFRERKNKKKSKNGYLIKYCCYYCKRQDFMKYLYANQSNFF